MISMGENNERQKLEIPINLSIDVRQNIIAKTVVAF